MVNIIRKDSTEFFQCEECSLVYSDRETAEKCQAWCSENKSCHLEIIKHAVKDFH